MTILLENEFVSLGQWNVSQLAEWLLVATHTIVPSRLKPITVDIL